MRDVALLKHQEARKLIVVCREQIDANCFLHVLAKEDCTHFARTPEMAIIDKALDYIYEAWDLS